MRRLTLAVFFSLAACGGAVPSSTDAVNPSTADMKHDRWAVLMSAEGGAVVASFTGSVSQEALDGCIDSWLGDDAPELMPAQKPTAVALRAFLSQCLSHSVPSDARGLPGGDASMHAISSENLRAPTPASSKPSNLGSSSGN